MGRNSIGMKLALGGLLIIGPLISLLYYYNFYAASVVHNQVSISNRNMISLYMQEIDTGLDTVDQYLIGLAASNYNVQILDKPRSEDDYVLAKLWLSNQLSTDLLMYKTMANSMFVYSPERQEIVDAIVGVDTGEYDRVAEYIKGVLFTNKEKLSSSWFTKTIESDHYLFRVLQSGDVWVGAWVNLSTLQSPLAYVDLGDDGASLFLDDQQRPLTDIPYWNSHQISISGGDQNEIADGQSDNYLVVSKHSVKGDFSLAAVIPTATVLQNLPYLNRIVILISIVGVVLLPLFFLFIRKVVLVPLNRIVTAMKRIGDGNVHTRIDPIRTSDEFIIVHQVFNRMMEQIEELKINVYEEQLDKQKAELQHLQLQINPHFFMNTLNLIYSLALDKDYELIKEMTMRLVHYFRYMFRSNLTFVPLREEIEHVRNYIGIHELRYQQKLISRIHADDQLMKIPVPPLIIQSFVENTLKHGYPDGDTVPVIEVSIELLEEEHHACLAITVKDEGRGFRSDVLQLLNAGGRIVDEQGEHIGVWNIWHRLRLLYEGKAAVTFRNGEPNGAIVQISLPLYEETKGELSV
ncbi:histidine kinase [Paenibacillus cellulosilyticus]|nr:histidine kinase [Paenibacillus cellulosilyticus]